MLFKLLSFAVVASASSLKQLRRSLSPELVEVNSGLIPSTTQVDKIRTTIEGWLAEDPNRRADMLRYAFHDAGTWNKVDGGAHGCILLGPGSPDFLAEDNNGLQIPTVSLMQLYADEQLSTVCSKADFAQFAAKVAVDVAAVGTAKAPSIPFRWGRTDCKNPPTNPSFSSRLPASTLSMEEMRTIFTTRLGFTDTEIVALMGAHTLGRMIESNSGYRGPWAARETVFDNQYFQFLQENNWFREIVASSGLEQWTGVFDGFVSTMLRVDVELGWDTSDGACQIDFQCPPRLGGRLGNTLNDIFRFANSQEAWVNVFGPAFVRLQEFGGDDLQPASSGPPTPSPPTTTTTLSPPTTTTPGPSACPASKPLPGSTCVGDLDCDYDPVQCCGEPNGFSTLASCENGVWVILQALVGCGECSCPASPPTPGLPCLGSAHCEYNPHECCGQHQGFETVAQCDGQQWQIAVADFLPCGDCVCPATVPQPGQTCHGSMQCNFNPVVCCGSPTGQFGAQANCAGGQWEVIATLPAPCGDCGGRMPDPLISGRCEVKAESPVECETLARKLKAQGHPLIQETGPVRVVNQCSPTLPNGCYYKRTNAVGFKLWYNHCPTTGPECSRERSCICDDGVES